MKTTITEQIALFEAKRLAAQNVMQGIVEKTTEEGRTRDEHEAEQYAQAEAEVKAVDEHIAMLRKHETLMLTKATAVTTETGTDGVQVGAARQVSVKTNLPPGITFVRMSLALAKAKGNPMIANEIAKEIYRDTPQVANVLKASISMGGTAELSLQSKTAVTAVLGSDTAVTQYSDMESEFVALLRPRTIMGRMDKLRRVPFLMRAGRALTGATGAFVGEGAPKPVNKQTFENVSLGYAKAAVIVVLSDEAVRFSNINAEMRAREDMIDGITTYLDKRFMDPAYSGVANVSPASITNAATRVQASGTTLAAIDTDVRSAMAPFSTSDVDPESAVWVMSAATALRLSMKRNTNDESAYPMLSMAGGTWYGLPVIVSSAMVASGSPSENQIALVTQREVFLADDGGISIDMSTEASVQMNDAPSAGAQSLVSLWQNNLVALRAERYINWAPRRASNLGIVLIENTNY